MPVYNFLPTISKRRNIEIAAQDAQHLLEIYARFWLVKGMKENALLRWGEGIKIFDIAFAHLTALPKLQ
jgi:hypothetical protein